MCCLTLISSHKRDFLFRTTCVNATARVLIVFSLAILVAGFKAFLYLFSCLATTVLGEYIAIAVHDWKHQI